MPLSIDLAHEVIASIVTLTAQRDQHSLERSLLRTLEEMLPEAEVWLLRGEGEAGGGEYLLLHGHKKGLPDEIIRHALLLKSEGDPKAISHAGRNYLLAKLMDAESGNRHLLITAQATWRALDLQLVQGLVRVYRNFVGLLYDSEKDTLTGLFNRRKLEAKLDELTAARLHGRRCHDQDHADYLAMLDLDRFKRINDTHGHLIGDEVLLVFANILRMTLRDSDLIFRYGGEEFIVLLQDTPNQVIEEVLERVRANVEKHVFPQVGRVTISIGHTRLDTRRQTNHAQIIEEADRALYYAKEHGRNQVRGYPTLLAQGEIMPTGRQPIV